MSLLLATLVIVGLSPTTWNFPVAESINYDKAVQQCEALGDEWRLPTVLELGALVAWDKPEVGAKVKGFQRKAYFSQTTQSTTTVFVVNFGNGQVSWSGRNGDFLAACTSKPVVKYTGSTLQEAASDERLPWNEATEYCSSKGLVLPSVVELHSVFLDERFSDAPEFNPRNGYWSSDSIDDEAWAVEFNHGSVHRLPKNRELLVRCKI